MRYIRNKKNILTKVVLCLCSLIFSICIAEYALSKIDIEGLSGHILYIRKSVDSSYDTAHGRVMFITGNCYPSDATGRFPLKLINPYDGK
jgi:hypothetical protein